MERAVRERQTGIGVDGLGRANSGKWGRKNDDERSGSRRRKSYEVGKFDFFLVKKCFESLFPRRLISTDS